MADSGRVRLVDLTPAFDAAWEKTKDLPDAERVNAFETNFAPNLPGFYDPKRAISGREERFQARILRGLKQFPEQRDYAALFMTERLTPDLPPRFGYYVGYRVAQRLGRRRSLNELARLPPRKVRPLIERTLREMAACSAAPGSPRPGPLAD